MKKSKIFSQLLGVTIGTEEDSKSLEPFKITIP